MESAAEEILTRVNNFTGEEQLMNYVATLGMETSPAVQFQLFQIRNPEFDDAFVQERLNALLECMQMEKVQSHISEEEIRGINQDHLLDEEMAEGARLLSEDGEWMQTGEGEDPQPGPSHGQDALQKLRYTMRKWTERTYARPVSPSGQFIVRRNGRERTPTIGRWGMDLDRGGGWSPAWPISRARRTTKAPIHLEKMDRENLCQKFSCRYHL